LNLNQAVTRCLKFTLFRETTAISTKVISILISGCVMPFTSSSANGWHSTARTDAVYLFCLDGGQLIGAMRAVPTLSPTLMSEIFPYLSIRGPIHRPDVYELSRIFVIPERRGEHAGPRIEMLLLTAIMEYGISIGLTGFSIVLESWWLPRFERCGWKAHPLGLPQMIDGMSVLAVLVDCDETTWKSLCGQIGLTNPTLTWQGLTGVNRQILPDISLLHSPAVQPAR
jgi:acyl-homoserine lactone synthase